MKKLISFRMMTVEDLLNKIVCGLPSCQVCKPYRDEILRRFSEKDARIKELISGYDCTGCDLDEKYNFKLKS